MRSLYQGPAKMSHVCTNTVKKAAQVIIEKSCTCMSND